MLPNFQSLLDALPGIAYVVDRELRICAYGEINWNRFAEGNNATEICEPRVIVGTPLDHFIAGEAKAFYRRCIADLISGKHRHLEFAFRCDRPDLKRFMRLLMTPVRATSDGGVSNVLIQSLTLEEEGRPPLNIYDHKALLRRLREGADLPILMMCSFCLDVRFPAGGEAANGTWMPGEKYYQSGGTSNVRISHGICPSCHGKYETWSDSREAAARTNDGAFAYGYDVKSPMTISRTADRRPYHDRTASPLARSARR